MYAANVIPFHPEVADAKVKTSLGLSLKEVKSYSIIPSGQWRANQADTSVLLPPWSLIHF